jgi:hypothetical protein
MIQYRILLDVRLSLGKIKLKRNVVESGIKHHKPNQTFKKPLCYSTPEDFAGLLLIGHLKCDL